MTLNAWTGGPDSSSPRKDRSTGIPPKLTPEQIDDIDQGMCGERECVQPFAQGVADARDQQWLDMLSAVPGTEKIVDMLDNFEYAVLGVMQGRRSPDEPAQMKADIRAAIEQALAALEQVAAWKEGGRRMAQEAIAAIRKCVGK